MDTGIWTRTGVVAASLLLAAYLLYPSYYYYFEATQEQRDDNDAFCEALPDWSRCSKFNLGLDLQGGVHLVMGVGVEKAVQQRLDRMIESMQDDLGEEKIAVDELQRLRGSTHINVKLNKPSDGSAFEKFLRLKYRTLEVLTHDSGSYELALSADEDNYTRETAVEQTIKAIRNRADKLGVTEPTIRKRGSENILIQLPGVKDPEQAVRIIGKTAQLEFKIVDEAATEKISNVEGLPKGVIRRTSTPQNRNVTEFYYELPRGKKAAVRAILEPLLDQDKQLAFGALSNRDSSTGADMLRTYVVEARAGITGDYLTSADPQQDRTIPGKWYVSMDFDAKGAKIFGELTGANIGRYMAIVLDDEVNSAPVIQSKISGGSARITLGGSSAGRGMFEQAKELALVLKAGALPAPVEVQEQRRVGQTLGKESVDRGRAAIIWGSALVLIFMLLYYRASGLIADVALVLNVVFVLAALALFEATLTLPGMAGIVLTIGMAVDANVIIFERIREELAVGKMPRAAIDSGYGRAFWTIVDANITTLIAGVVLLQYGSGPVQGFAVTLIVGILCSMFTAIFVTRLIYDVATGSRRLQSLSI